MIFSSINFIYFFLPITIIVYFASKNSLKNVTLLLFSLAFYFIGEPKHCLLILLAGLNGYVHGILIEHFRGTKYSKILLFSSSILSLLPLVFFKYMDFFIENINYLTRQNFAFLNLALPIGISFYTFQILSYTLDVYYERVEACRNPISFLTYVCLFPQLIAGPIVRYEQVSRELKDRTYSPSKFTEGINRFIIGVGKKVLIANNLASLVKYLELNNDTLLSHWMIAIAFSLQIYYDFSGYSDMAIGLGHFFGFEFPENFNYPFIAKSITDFWRRWHISLSSFFRDYLYIPLGGNRVSTVKWCFNIFVVWAVTGLWHGASWNFVIWGVYFAVILIIEKLILGKFLIKLPITIQHIYSKLLIVISFVIFYNEDFKMCLIRLGNMFRINYLPIFDEISIYYCESYIILIIFAIVGSTPFFKHVISKLHKVDNTGLILSIVNPIFNIVVLLVSTAYLVDNSFSPFLYFRF